MKIVLVAFALMALNLVAGAMQSGVVGSRSALAAINTKPNKTYDDCLDICAIAFDACKHAACDTEEATAESCTEDSKKCDHDKFTCAQSCKVKSSTSSVMQ